MRTARVQKRSVLGVTVMTAAILCLPTTAESQTPDALSEIRARVESYEQAWNTHRASAVAAFFTEDADMIIGNGPRIVGREAIEDSWGVYFSHIDAGREGTFAVESLRLISPEVALINIDSTTAGRNSAGEEMPTRLARGTWVVVRHDEDWWISALRAQPAEGEVRTGPGRDR